MGSTSRYLQFAGLRVRAMPVDGQDDLQTMGHSETLVLGVTVGVARGLAVLLEVFLVQVV